MLPFHQKNPNYGGKLKKEKGNEPHPLREGGPLERAIREDLCAILKGFEAPQNHTHCPVVGQGFASFAAYLKPTKVTSILTRFVPPRCDVPAYVQLVYAACLSLLDKSNSDLINMAVVCLLYVLSHSTKLMAPQPEALETVPLAWQHRAFPSAVYRHWYWANSSKVRVDPKLFARILELQERCHWEVAECASRKQVCSCALAVDVPHIIARISWQYASYTGPASLQGLAGHAEYPYPAIRATYPPSRTTEGQIPAEGAACKQPMTGDSSSMEINCGMANESNILPYANELLSAVQEYRGEVRSTVGALSMQLVAHSSRKKAALQLHDHLREKLLTDNAWSLMCESMNAAGFDPTDGTMGTTKPTPTGTMMAPQANVINQGLNKPESLTWIEVPPKIPSELQYSIRDAVAKLLERRSFIRCNESTGTETGSSLQPICIETESTTSTVTGIGRMALQKLLSEVKSPTRQTFTENFASVVTTTTGVGKIALQNLLLKANVPTVPQPDTASESVVGKISGVGRKALQDLISIAANDKADSCPVGASLLPVKGKKDYRKSHRDDWLLGPQDTASESEQAAQCLSDLSSDDETAMNHLVSLASMRPSFPLHQPQKKQRRQPVKATGTRTQATFPGYSTGSSSDEDSWLSDSEQAGLQGRASLLLLLSKAGKGK